MNIRAALNKKRVITIVIILLLVSITGGVLLWRAISDEPQSVVSRDSTEKRLSDVTYDTASTYKDSGSYAKGTITVAGVALDGTSFKKLEIADSVGEGEVYLDNLTISDELLIRGGGENSVYLDITPDRTSRVINEDNPGCSVSKVQVEKQNTHIVIGSRQIGDLIVHGTNHVEIYGHVDKITVVGSKQKDHEYTSGIFIMDGATVGQIELQEQTTIYGSRGSVGQVSASVPGIDTAVQPLPAEEIQKDQDTETEMEDEPEENRRGTNNRGQRPSGTSSGENNSVQQQTGGGTGNNALTGSEDSNQEPSQPDTPQQEPSQPDSSQPDPPTVGDGGQDQTANPGGDIGGSAEKDPDLNPGLGGDDDAPGGM